MPLVPGRDAAREARGEGRSAWTRRSRSGRARARARAAHARGIVHRDLKPENILFTADGRPLVADLGLAKHFSPRRPRREPERRALADGRVLGHRGLHGPRADRRREGVGPAADVFALGAILYECLAGRAAFEGDSLMEVIGKVDSGEFPSLGSLLPRTPRWLQALVGRALARNPKKRFPDGAALARAFAERRDPGRPWAWRLALGLVLALALGYGGLALNAHLAEQAAKKKAALVEEAIEAGRKREVRGELAKAAEAYSRAIEADPLSASAWGNRGRVKTKLGDADGAIVDCTRSIELDPTNVGPWGNRAFAKEQKGDYDGAIADGTKAIELEPAMGSLWHNRAQARSDKGDNEGALKDCARAIELDPGLKDAWLSRRHSPARDGDLDGAIADAAKAIELAPGLAAAWFTRGKARQTKRDLEGALADFTRAIELDAKLEAAFVRRGEVRRDVSDYQGSIEELHASARAPAGGGRLLVQASAPRASSRTIRAPSRTTRRRSRSSSRRRSRPGRATGSRRSRPGRRRIPERLRRHPGAHVERERHEAERAEAGRVGEALEPAAQDRAHEVRGERRVGALGAREARGEDRRREEERHGVERRRDRELRRARELEEVRGVHERREEERQGEPGEGEREPDGSAPLDVGVREEDRDEEARDHGRGDVPGCAVDERGARDRPRLDEHERGAEEEEVAVDRLPRSEGGADPHRREERDRDEDDEDDERDARAPR